VKRRKFATAVAFGVTLLVAALAAASVSSAASSQSAATWTKGPVKTQKLNAHASLKGTSKFANAPVGKVPFIPTAPANANAIKQHDRLIPGKLGPKGSLGSGGAVASGASAIPHAPSLPIVDAHKSPAAQNYGLNAYNQDSVGGYTDTPPDQALAEGNGFVFEAVNNVFQISDTSFNHMTSAEPMEQFWATAILATGYCNVSDPKAYYDNVTRKWYVTEVAYGPPGCAPGSAVFIAVSTTSDPLSIYNIYVMDTSFDGTTCGPDGCLADQPLLGMNKNALFISTNSFDWDSPAFNGSQMYIIDSTALAAGFVFPNIVYIDIGALVPTPEGLNGCGTVGYPLSAYCWYSIQPGTSPNLSQTTGANGNETAMSALDWLGSVDNRIAVWFFQNTATINQFAPSIVFGYIYGVGESYGFPFTDTPFYSPYAEQPSSGNTPLCDFFVGPFCEPGPIANNDDRMNEVKVIGGKTAQAWGGLNTDATVADPIGHLHRRSAIAWFNVQFTLGCGFVCTIGWHNYGYVANWNNDVIFPAIGVATDGTSAAMVYTLTGNTNFPSVAVSRVSSTTQVSNIGVVRPGADVLDDFAWYFFGSPRWGDYSAAVGDGRSIYLATEYIQFPSCSDAEFLFDPTCGGTRSEFSNWGTGLVKVNV
jgi:hypothetical protein